MNEPFTEPKSKAAPPNRLMSLLIGVFLMLPALFVYNRVQLMPALDTIQMSMQKVDILGAAGRTRDVGTDNYDKLAQDPAWGQAVGYTLSIVALRLLIVAAVPVMVGLLVGGQSQGPRLFSRVLMAGMTILIAPIVTAILWGAFGSPYWGREMSSLDPLPGWMMLNTAGGARTSLLVADAITTLLIAAVVGGAAFIAVMRGRSVSGSHRQAGLGVWLLGLLLTAASLPQTFDLPYVLTGGGPGYATTTLPVYLFQEGFQRLNMGYAAAGAVPLILVGVLIGFLVWAVLTGFRLRLMYTPAPPRMANGGLGSLLSVPLLLLIALPALGLMLWGIWLTSTQPATSNAAAIDSMRLFLNTISGPWAAIWLIQIPVTYLAGLSLGFVRPFNRFVAQALFLLLMLMAFVPLEALMIPWFLLGREAGMVNTSALVGFAWLTSAFSLMMFKLFFDGAAEKYHAARAAGQRSNDAFLNTVFLPSLPIVALVGVVLSFASLHSLLWPLVVVIQPDLFTASVQLAVFRGQFGTQGTEVVGLALSFIGLITLLFLPLFVLLHVFVLDRLALVAGPPVDVDLISPVLPKGKRDDTSAAYTSEQTF